MRRSTSSRTSNQINDQSNPRKDYHENKPDPFSQASQVDQSTNPRDQEWNRRQGNKNHTGNEEWRITKLCYHCAVRISIIVSNGCASNQTSNDHAYTNDIHQYADKKENANRPFSHEIPPIREIVLVRALSVNDFHIS